MLVRLLGDFGLAGPDGRPIDIPSMRTRYLLAAVCLHPDKAMGRDTLSAMLWPGRFPSQAKASLRQSLYDLGKLLEPFGGSILVTTRTAVALDLSKARTDLAELENALVADRLDVAKGMIDRIGMQPLLGNLAAGGGDLGWLRQARDHAQSRLLRAIADAASLGAGAQSTQADQLVATADKWIEALRGEPGAAEKSSGAAPPTSAVKTYSVAVLPFEHDGLEAMANEIARELTDRLSRTPHLYVAAFEPLPPDANSGPNLADAARPLGVRYVVSGVIVGGHKAITLRLTLVNSQTRQHLWSKRMAMPAGGLPADLGFVSELAMSLLCEIQIAEGTALGQASSREAQDFEVVLKTEMLRRIYSRERAREITDHLSEVVERDLASPTGHAYLAIQLAQNVVSQFAADCGAEERSATFHAEKAFSLAPLAPEVLCANGIVNAMFGNCPAAVRFLERAHKRNPDNPHTLAMLGWQTCWLHNDSDAIELIRQAEDFAPHHPRMANWAHYRAVSLAKVGRFEEALEAHQDCYDRNPNYHYPMIYGASLMAHMGRYEEARAVLAKALRLAPYYSLEHFLRKPADWPYGWNEKFTAEQALTSVKRVWFMLRDEEADLPNLLQR